MASEACKWELENNWQDIHWNTDCKNAFIFFDGDPDENGFVYCPYCGKRLEVVDGTEVYPDEEEQSFYPSNQ